MRCPECAAETDVTAESRVECGAPAAARSLMGAGAEPSGEIEGRRTFLGYLSVLLLILSLQGKPAKVLRVFYYISLVWLAIWESASTAVAVSSSGGVRQDLVDGSVAILMVGLLPPAGIYLLVLYFDRGLVIVLLVTVTASSGQLTEGQLRPGDCLRNSTNLGPGLGNNGPWPSTFTAVPCAMPHVAEIFFAGDPWRQSLAYPGFAVIADQGPARCGHAFRAYDGIAPAASEFSIAYITPDSSTWASGDRLVVCIAYVSDFSGPSYGGDLWDYSIKGSRR